MRQHLPFKAIIGDDWQEIRRRDPESGVDNVQPMAAHQGRLGKCISTQSPTPYTHIMATWLNALSPLNLGRLRQWAVDPAAPAPAPAPCGKGLAARKSRYHRVSKSALRVTPFQKYKRETRASWSSGSSGSQQSYSSRGSTSSAHSVAPNPASDHLRRELVGMRLRGNWDGSMPADLLARPGVDTRLARQGAGDRASLALLPTQAPPVFTTNPLSRTPSASSSGSSSDFDLRPATSSFLGRNNIPPRASSFILQKWNGVRKELNERREDRRIYAVVRGQDPMALNRWERYEQRWVNALEANDTPPLLFTDIPWPVMHTPHNGSHITAVEVYRFVLCTEDLETVPFNAVPRLEAEAARWVSDTFRAVVIPRVVPRDQQDAAAAAATVLEILLSAVRDLKSTARFRR
ncbi:hypothetical protein C8R46DRAFT_1078646 [Mycena filopes]|nr:hypothetical protein C8R46DRAFT_1078646 [Mycena filopes]